MFGIISQLVPFFRFERIFYNVLYYFVIRFASPFASLTMLIPIIWILFFVGKLFERAKEIQKPMILAFVPFWNQTEFTCVAGMGRCFISWIIAGFIVYPIAMYKFCRNFNASIITSVLAIRFPYIVLPILYFRGEKRNPYNGCYFESIGACTPRRNVSYGSYSHSQYDSSYSSSSGGSYSTGAPASSNTGTANQVETCPYCGTKNEGGYACSSCLLELNQ